MSAKSQPPTPPRQTASSGVSPIASRQYLTTDRKPFVVRSATPADAPDVAALQRSAMDEREDYFVRTPQEFDAESPAVTEQLIALLSQPNSLWLIAERDGELMGSLDFHGGHYAYVRHVGHFGMTVRPEYRSQGVGTALIEMLLLWAHTHPAVEKVTTTFFTNNTRAVALCQRFGFQSEGRRHREYLVKPGRYLDGVCLSKWVK